MLESTTVYSKKENIEYIPEHYDEDDDDSQGSCQTKKTQWLKLGALDDDGEDDDGDDDDDGDVDENNETYR